MCCYRYDSYSVFVSRKEEPKVEQLTMNTPVLEDRQKVFSKTYPFDQSGNENQTIPESNITPPSSKPSITPSSHQQISGMHC